jgi:tetraacyldisaccharide 4'-kinase
MDERGVGNGRLQPAGPLREPWPREVDFLLHRGSFDGGFALQRALAPYALHADGSQVSFSDLTGQSPIALAGIAQPENFFSMLRDSGLTLADTFALPDHYDFNSNPRTFDAGQVLICTEKDAPKLRQAAWAQHLTVFAVPLLVSLPHTFYTALDEKLSSTLAKQST